MTRYFSNYHRPGHGESLWSWLRRGARSGQFKCRDALSYLASTGIHDVDLALENVHIDVLSNLLEIDRSYLMQLVQTTDYEILAYSDRTAYCQHCIVEDLIKGNRPKYQLTWSQKWVAVCFKHGCPLSTFETRVLSDDPVTNALADLYVTDTQICIFDAPPLPPLKNLSTAYRNVRCGREAIALLALIFQLWFNKYLQREIIQLPNGRFVHPSDLLRLMDAIGRVGYRKLHKQSSYNSMLLSFLPRQQRPALSTTSDPTLENILCSSIGEIKAGNRIGLLAFMGIYLNLPCSKNLLRHFNRALWTDGVHWDSFNIMFKDETFDYRPWIIERLSRDATDIAEGLISDEYLR